MRNHWEIKQKKLSQQDEIEIDFYFFNRYL